MFRPSALIVCFSVFLWSLGNQGQANESKDSGPVVAKKAEAPAKAAKGKASNRKEMPSGLVIEDLKLGSGPAAALNQEITVHYRGTLKSNGKEFDSSLGKAPISFPLKEGRLIKGWTDGIPGMKVGGKRRLEVPAALGYGERGTPGGPIPPNADLIFEVELMGVK
jgi:FKBP-type peptidyl-prolyl cis-trans isomerase FkpA